jgi:chromosome partitioning protein
MGFIITIASQKGGSGKSTITMQLAGVLSTREEETRVLVLDADQQGTCLKWAAMAAEDTPFPATVMGMTEPIIHRQLPRIRADYNFILVDTPPHAEAVARSAIIAADLVIIPVLPSPVDLWSAATTRKIVLDAQVQRPEIACRLLLSRVVPHTALAQETLEALEVYDIPILSTRLHQRQAYPRSALRGGTVLDLDAKSGSQAAEEVRQLTKELVEVLNDSSSKEQIAEQRHRAVPPERSRRGLSRDA